MSEKESGEKERGIGSRESENENTTVKMESVRGGIHSSGARKLADQNVGANRHAESLACDHPLGPSPPSPHLSSHTPPPFPPPLFSLPMCKVKNGSH